MNVFVLDINPEKSARYLNDRHLVKMILEHAQIMSTVAWLTKGLHVYRPTHKNHPCVKWCAESYANYAWLKNYTECMNAEWKFRFGHQQDHKSWQVLSFTKPDVTNFKIALRRTPFALAMPEKYRSDDPVKSYRDYYMGDKRHLAKWTKREQPEWWN